MSRICVVIYLCFALCILLAIRLPLDVASLNAVARRFASCMLRASFQSMTLDNDTPPGAHSLLSISLLTGYWSTHPVAKA